mgnify:FL=1
MKITKNQLKQIIKEELGRAMSEEEDFSTHEAAAETVVNKLLDDGAGKMAVKQGLMAWTMQYAFGSMDPSINLGEEGKKRLYAHGKAHYDARMRRRR